jgi:hypothetical protein
MKIAIFDPFNGAGGDMIVATLIGLSLTREDFRMVVDELNLNIHYEVREVNVRGIKAKRVEVRDEKSKRKFKEVLDLIDSSELNNSVKEDSKRIFEIMARAEGKIHGYNYKNAVFHEIGSDDAIFDVVCSVIGIRRLIDMGYVFFANPIRLGSGFVNFSHGKYPVPAPATLEILKNSPLEVLLEGEGELLTPTAAAILSHYCRGVFRYPLIVKKISYGAGSRDSEVPNVLRLILGETEFYDSVVVLETSVDDISGELMAHSLEKLSQINGVLDVTAYLGVGKKGRPSFLLRVISKFERCEDVSKELMKLTGSLGVRIIPVHHRMIAGRGVMVKRIEIDGRIFDVRVKFSEPYFHHAKPEFEDVIRISDELGKSPVEVYRKILSRLEDADPYR